MRNIIVGACLLWIVGATGMAERVREAPHCNEADRVMTEFAAKALESGLVLTGFGGQMGHEVQSFALNFSTQSVVDIQKARALYIQVMERFVQWVNQDRKIRPYLSEFPISSRNVELMLSFKDSQGRLHRDGNICLMFNLPERDRIIYNRMERDKMVKAEEEPMDRALAIQMARAMPEPQF
ncbi:MAG: hypothetical protein ACOYKZ_00535 [Chlamydiia bacterium]